MSYHIVHILQHNSFLYNDRGSFVCKISETEEKRLPMDDIFAVIIAARAVNISGHLLSCLIEKGVVILHCDDKYKPIGKTVGLYHIIHNDIFENQIKMEQGFTEAFWQKLLTAKVENQAFVLDFLKAEHKLWEYLKNKNIDEGNTARHYWSFYFKNFGKFSPETREREGAEDPVNGMLNYGYAVLSAILHRSLIAHGVNTSIGVHHKYRFKSDPLLYDTIEPIRPMCDFMLLRFRMENKNRKIDEWVKFAAKDLTGAKIVLKDGKTVKLYNLIDKYANSVANAYKNNDLNLLFIPMIKEIKFDDNG